MRTRAVAVIVGTGVLLIAGSLASGQTGGTAKLPTFWNFLGIPQSYQKVRDARANRQGNNPQRERVPPPKRIADPENLQSDNPAIKTAAQIKKEEDLKEQKIKAIKYLATVGCACYPGVREALTAALDDCIEEVRYEAAVALCQVAGNPNNRCENGCCDAAVMTKLHQMAYGQDAKCCFKETSPRVRSAAEMALNACKRKHQPSGPAAPAPKRETPDKEVPMPTPAVPKELPGDTERGPLTPGDNLPPSPPVPSNTSATPYSGPKSWTGEPQETPISYISNPTEATPTSGQQNACPAYAAQGGTIQWCPRCGCYHPCPTPSAAPGAPSATTPSPSDIQPVPDMTGAAATPPTNALAGNLGAAAGPASALPNMIGDFFGGQPLSNGTTTLSDPAAGGGVGRTKLVENTSPLPRDRLLLNYSFFDDVPLRPEGVPVHRFTTGFEKTFFDGLMSFEMKIPVATTLSNDVFSDGSADTSELEFGNLVLTTKSYLIRRQTWAVTGGLSVITPTAADSRILDAGSGDPLLVINNEAVHLAPFVGFLWTPNDRFFAQGVAQWEVEANPNPVLQDFGSGLEQTAELHDTTYQYLSLGVGSWLYRNPCARLSGWAWTTEVHWNRSLKDLDNNGPVFHAIDGRVIQDVDIWDLTLGTHFELNQRTTATVAYCIPLTGDANRQFDGELRLMLDWRFGPQTRASRTPL